MGGIGGAGDAEGGDLGGGGFGGGGGEFVFEADGFEVVGDDGLDGHGGDAGVAGGLMLGLGMKGRDRLCAENGLPVTWIVHEGLQF